MITQDVHLRLATAVARRLSGLADTVEITGSPGVRILIHVDPHSVGLAAELGASLLAAARRQDQEGGAR